MPWPGWADFEPTRTGNTSPPPELLDLGRVPSVGEKNSAISADFGILPSILNILWMGGLCRGFRFVDEYLVSN